MKPIITRLVFILTCLLIGFKNHVHAHSVRFELFDRNNKLSNAETYHMYQDQNGCIWFATDRGICVYNGYKFRYFNGRDGIPDRTIFRLYPQEDGKIWCSTFNNNFYIIDPDQHEIKPYEYNHITATLNHYINDDILIEKNGTLHVGYINLFGTLSINAEGTVLNYPKKTKDSNSAYIILDHISDDCVMTYMSDQPTSVNLYSYKNSVSIKKSGHYHKARLVNDVMLFSDLYHLYLFKQGKQFKVIKTPKRVIGVGTYDSTHFWVGFDYGGAAIYDMEGNETEFLLQNKSVSHILTDHENNVWISTLYSGIYFRQSLKVTRYTLNDFQRICRLSLTKNGQLFINLYNGLSYSYDGHNFEQNPITKGSSLSLSQYYSPIDKTLHFNGNGKLISVPGSSVLSNNFINNMSDDRYHMPIAINTKNFYLFDKNLNPKLIKTQSKILDACYVPSGILIAKEQAVYFMDTLNYSIRKLKFLKGGAYDIDIYNDSLIVLGTCETGVIVYTPKYLHMISVKDGLSDNTALKTYIQNDTTIWVCTPNGLDCIIITHDHKVTIKSMVYDNGLIRDEATDIIVNTDTVWVGTRRGLRSFSLNDFYNYHEADSHFLKINLVTANGKPIQNYNRLNATQNRITIHFEGVSYIPGTGLDYRYRLEGIDKTWNHTKSLNVQYESLPPGEYTFYIQAGKHNTWSSQFQRFHFSISPPFYKTLWFITITLTLFIILIYAFFRLRILAYNKAIIRELLRLVLKKMKRKSKHIIVREKGKDVKIHTPNILFVKASGNYLEIHTLNGRVVTREKISNFLSLVPDPIEYLQIHRSYIVRIDQIEKKSASTVTINGIELQIGNTYTNPVSKFEF